MNVGELIDTTSVAEAREQRRSEQAPVITNDALHQAGTLTVGIRATEQAPLAVTSSDGTQMGIDVDTAYALADQLGLTSVAFVSVSDVETALTENCDIVMGVTAEDAGAAPVVGNYVQSATGVFTRQDVTVPIDASALSDATVGVQGGSVSEGVLSGYDLGVTESTYANLNEAFDALNAGEVDYVVCDAYAGAYLATAYTGVHLAGTLDSPMAVGVAVSSSTELQTAAQGALDAIATNGVGDVVRSRWVGALPALTDEIRVTNLVTAAPEEGAEDAGTESAADTAESAADAVPAE